MYRPSSKITHEKHACPGTVLSLGARLQLKAAIKKKKKQPQVIRRYEEIWGIGIPIGLW